MRLLATLATPYLLLWLSYAYLTINICLFVCWLLFHIFFCFYHLTLELATAQLDAIAFILIIKYYNIHIENITFALVRRTAFCKSCDTAPAVYEWEWSTPQKVEWIRNHMKSNENRRTYYEWSWHVYIYIYIYSDDCTLAVRTSDVDVW